MSSSLAVWSGFAALFSGLAVAVVVAGSVLSERREVQRSLHAISIRARVGGAPATSFTDRVVLPTLDRFADLGRRLSPGGARDRLVRLLDLAGNPTLWPSERLLAVKSLGMLGALVVGLLLGLDGDLLRTTLLTLPAAALAFWLPDILVHNSAQKRQTKIQKTLPDALDLLTITVEAGMGFDAALNHVARNTEGPLTGEFIRVLQEMQMKSRADALRALGERTTVPELRTFVSSLVQADKLGVPVGRVLREQSKEMRLKRRQRAEEQAMKVPVKILFPMVVCILPVLFVVVLAPAFMQIGQLT